MMLMNSTMAVHLHSSSSIAYCRPIWSSDDVMGVSFAIPWNKVKRLRKNLDNSLNKRKGSAKNRIQASGKYLSSGSDQIGGNGRSRYHPFEDISDSEAMDAGEGQLTAPETSRTIIEVNSKATLMFSSLINDEVHENIFWPDLPYLTDEHGNVYFQVNNDEDIMQSLTSENSHAVASDNPIDFMVQPPAGLAIQGLLRPAFIEEQSVIQKHRSSPPDSIADMKKVEKALEDNVEDIGIFNGHAHLPASSEDNFVWTENLEKVNGLANGTAFYKLEMIKIQLISAYGHQTAVEIEDYTKARPDAIAHSAAKIISRVNAAGEKTINALKSLCWRCKDLEVQEASLIGVDSLGFDLRVCSGTQVQMLRFAFNSRVTSEYSAERQLNDLLFLQSNQKVQKVKEVRRKEC